MDKFKNGDRVNGIIVLDRDEEAMNEGVLVPISKKEMSLIANLGGRELFPLSDRARTIEYHDGRGFGVARAIMRAAGEHAPDSTVFIDSEMLAKELRATQARLQRANANVDNWRERFNQARRQVRMVERNTDNLAEEKTELQNRVRALDGTIDDLRENLQALRQTVRAEKDALRSANGEIALLRQKLRASRSVAATFQQMSKDNREAVRNAERRAENAEEDRKATMNRDHNTIVRIRDERDALLDERDDLAGRLIRAEAAIHGKEAS